MAIVVASYRQTVHAYEQSGGAYIVAKENLGRLPSLVAAAALLVDYVLDRRGLRGERHLRASPRRCVARARTASSSRSPAIALIAFVNLRGVREAGILFAIPTYGFILALYAAIGTGLARCAARQLPARDRSAPAHGRRRRGRRARDPARLLVGASALTGVEAIANGVNAFRRPQSVNAARTLAVLGTIAISLFLGVSWLAVHMHARPSATDSVLSQIARAVFPAGGATSFMYWVVQVFTFAILVLAANTSYPGLPAARGAARARPLRRPAVHEPRRPARLLERRRRARPAPLSR